MGSWVVILSTVFVIKIGYLFNICESMLIVFSFKVSNNAIT